jgi:hypothetical protein
MTLYEEILNELEETAALAFGTEKCALLLAAHNKLIRLHQSYVLRNYYDSRGKGLS